MTQIGRAAAYIAQYDPQFSSGIKGATEAEILELEKSSGGPLPAIYRDYLSLMGHGMDFLTLADANFSIDAVTRFYAHGYKAPPNYWLIGRAKGDPYIDIYLFSPTGAESRIVSFPAPPATGFREFARTHLRFLAGSLPQWLCTSSFDVLKFPYLRSAAVLDGKRVSAGLLGACEQALLVHGLKPLWFSNDWVRAYENPDVLAVTTEYPNERLIVDLHATDDEKLMACVEVVRGLLG